MLLLLSQVFQAAVAALNEIFFVGLQEEYDLSVELMIKMFNSTIPVKNNRERLNKVEKPKLALLTNKRLMKLAEEVNSFDNRLYEIAVSRYCSFVNQFADLKIKQKKNGKVSCDS